MTGRTAKRKRGHFQYGQFRHVWQETAKVWKSPEGDLFDVVESEERVRGFKRCNRCEFVHEKIVKAKTKEEREYWRKKQQRHWTNVRHGRKQYGENIQRALANKDSVISISIDAADQRKMRIPVTSSDAKRIGALWQLKLKVTGVIIHGDGYYPFVSFPWLKTGANITSTIMHALHSAGKFDGKETAYIQWDGANDNVAFTNVYYFVWLLLASQTRRATLKTIVISRFLVGHTHFDVDQLFSVFSQFIFGSRRLQRKRRDMFTLSEFKEMTERAHKNLKEFQWLHATYNWDKFFKNTKEGGQLETGLQKAFVIRLTVDDTVAGRVFIESKPMMGGDVAWSQKVQLYPHRDMVSRPLPGFDEKPDLAEFTAKDLDEVFSSLRWFADPAKNEYVQTTPAQRAEILDFVDNVPNTVRDVPADELPRFRKLSAMPAATYPANRTNVAPVAPFVPPPSGPRQADGVVEFGFFNREVRAEQHRRDSAPPIRDDQTAAERGDTTQDARGGADVVTAPVAGVTQQGDGADNGGTVSADATPQGRSAQALQRAPLMPPRQSRSRYRVGARVKIRPAQFGRDWAIGKFGSNHKNTWMNGTIVRAGTRKATTRGSGAVWRVHWDLDNEEDEHAQSSLRLAALLVARPRT